MKKGFVMICSVGLMMVLVACGGNKVDDELSKKYIDQAEEVISLLNESNYEEVHKRLNDEMKTGLPVKDMEELTPIIEEAGSFEEIDKASVEEQEGLYVTVLVATYSEENRVFTITFNEENEIAGLFIK